MKYATLLNCLVLGMLCFSSATIPNPIAYYSFNGDADDMSGNGRHGEVYSATLTVDRFDVPNSAYAFDGISSYIEIDGSAFDCINQCTFSMWVKPRNGQNSQATLLDKPRSSAAGWRLIQVESGSFSWIYASSTTSSDFQLTRWKS